MLALAAVVMPLAFMLFSGPTFQGRTAGEWLKIYDDRVYLNPTSERSTAEVQWAFRALGTNAVPYLASRITRSQKDSTLETRWMKLRSWARLVRNPPREIRRMEAGNAAALLAYASRPPGEMLVPLLEPALLSTDPDQRANALGALQGISSGHSLARPHLERGLKDTDAKVQRCALLALEQFKAADVPWAVGLLWRVSLSP